MHSKSARADPARTLKGKEDTMMARGQPYQLTHAISYHTMQLQSLQFLQSFSQRPHPNAA